MNPMTYLCFTLMSILIQFCLMDFTNETGKSVKSIVDINQTNRKISNDVIKRITQKPHALYYRTKTASAKKGENSEVYPNSTITEKIFTTTDLVTTEIDLFYEDGNSTIDGAFTSESPLATTEFDNVTEITFLYKTSTVKPPKEKKNIKKQDRCSCDLLFELCDINCCCDTDCTDQEITLFNSCEGSQGEYQKRSQHELTQCSNNAIESLFCIVKTNLPENKEIRPNQADTAVINRVYKWHTVDKLEPTATTKKATYKIGDPLLLLSKGTLKYLDIPIPLVNNYCKSKKPIRFLVNEVVKCNVKLKEINALQILKITEEAKIVTYTNSSTGLNCSSLLCANWSVILCNEEACQNYNQQLHEPTCSEGYCSNIAYRIEYTLYCNETGILTSAIKLYVKDVSTTLQFIQQEIRVNFLMANDTSRIIKLSGNPGYVQGLPVLASTLANNQTQQFYNNTQNENYILLPDNKNGMCVLNNILNNKLNFDENKRINCKFTVERIKSNNATDICVKIQDRIKNFLRLNSDIFVSPFGKPQENVKWTILSQINRTNVYGGYNPKDSLLLCYNIVTRFSFTIVYVDSGKNENKIIEARIVGTPRNLTMSSKQNYFFVLSVDVKFIDASGPAMKVYAGAPLLSIHLPKNFFLPFY
ncbi:tectonic-1 isoform X1 [Aricia agestis]|uniref:tectonic-1 isoform X1 n=1 Tax=Aricia agestis TaxID=91739 RepID=UPI001C2028E2|nr:tectonic-1 isoform X1 [Aricia agestis]